MACWNPDIEMMSKKDLDDLQLGLLKDLVRKNYERSPFYRQKMLNNNVRPEDIRTLDDVVKLPFMSKKDLRDNYPDRLFTASKREIVRYHASSGTTGKPTIVGYTRNDIEMWSESLGRALRSAGLGADDVVQVANTYGLFTGGLGFHYAAEKIGAAVVPASTGNTERQIQMIEDLGVTAMAATPSYLIYVGEVAEKIGYDLRNSTLRTGLLGAEPWSDKMRDRIQNWLGVKGINCFGASELSGPLWSECEDQCGIHLWRDIALVEIIDPETGERLGPGERGELVITMLQKEAFPIIRYRMGDITMIENDKCSCGRDHPRMMRITGRVDDMLIIRGINVFPSQVEHCLHTNPEVGNEFQIIVERRGALDDMMVKVELKPEAFTDNILELNALRERISSRLRSSLNVGAKIELVPPGSLPRFEGKAKRVVDRREI
ncbi:MAG: phenylacetate--CoA ligase [Methanomassiliicoccales archaeon]|nr:MAG: phenylacetate--CoA ligase [Methanomassiliicoccales archaeon]